jgi:hypothetical protein
MVVLVLALWALGACGPGAGTQVEVGKPMKVEAPPGVEAPEPEAAKIALEAWEIPGIVFEPEALNLAEMPGNGTTVKRTIDEQKKRVAKAKKAAAAKEKLDLGLLLWYTPPPGTGKEARKALRAQREEALKVLTEAAAQPGASEELLWAYAVAEHYAGDPAKAKGAWDALIGKFAASKQLARYQALRNVIDLKERAPLSQSQPASLDGAPYEAAYVMAWTRFRGGDAAGAQAALLAAAERWTNLESLVNLRRDFILIMTRTGGSPQVALPALGELVKKDNGDWDKVAGLLAEAYGGAGEFAASIEVYDVLFQNAPPEKQSELRLLQALAWTRLVEPAKAAQALAEAWKKLDGLPAAADPLRDAVAKRIGDLGIRFHFFFQKSRDERFLQPAKDLYALYLSIPGRADAAKVKDEYLPALEQTVKVYAEAKGVGELPADLVKRHMSLYLEQVGACYEAALQSDPALTSEQSLSVSVAADGKVTEAAASDDNVGKCIAGRAKSWVFPATGVVTKITAPFKFAPKSSAAASSTNPTTKPAAPAAAQP